MGGSRQNGTFLIRKSIKTANLPYTLDVMYDQRVCHIQIRRRVDSLLALGAHEKPSEVVSPSQTVSL